jgi:inhibitor of KinA
MRIDPLGDSAFILRDLDEAAYVLAERINSNLPPGAIEAVASYETVGVYYSVPGPDASSLEGYLESTKGATNEAREGKYHRIPVCYDMAEDMEVVCERTGLSQAEVVKAHTAEPFRCYAVGFCPGFPYLGYLPPELQGMPRLSQPRVRVTPGSVGITGAQTGIYPLPRPGGWQLIGRTPLTIVDPEAGFFPIVAGDEVQFEPITEAEFARLEGKRL